MARKKITIDLSTGDAVTAHADLEFQFYDADSSDAIITTANFAAVGSQNAEGTDGANLAWTLTSNSMEIDGVDVGSTTNIKVAVKDEAGLVSALSAAKTQSSSIETSSYATKYDPAGTIINSADGTAGNGDNIKTIVAEGTAPINFTISGTFYPTLQTNVLNTHSVFRFGVNDRLDAVANIGLGSNLTMIAVAMSTTSMTSSNESFFGHGVESANRLQFNIDTRVGVSGGRVMGLSNDGTGTKLLQDSTLADLSASTFEVIAISYELGVQQRVWKNGTLVGTTALSGAGYSEANWIMGELYTNDFNGDIAIIYCWDSLLSDTDVVAYSNELVTKYGL